MKTIRTWIGIGIAEGLLVLLLAAIAPIFINSSFPIVGLLLWAVILGLVGGSIGYVLWRLRDAAIARFLFIQVFPDYGHLGITYFLEYSSNRVQSTIDQWIIVHSEPEFQSLNMSPLEFLSGHKNDVQKPPSP